MNINQKALGQNWNKASQIKQTLPEGWCFLISVSEYDITFLGKITDEITQKLSKMRFVKEQIEEFTIYTKTTKNLHLSIRLISE